jgi:hypothetical protein
MDSLILCLGCKKSFHQIQAHWSQNPICFSVHEVIAGNNCQQQQPIYLNDLSDGDGSASKNKSFGSKSDANETNLDNQGILGSLITGPRKQCPNDGSVSSSLLDSTTAKGTYHCQATLADGSIVETRVST